MSTTKTLEFVKIPNDWDSALLGREVDPIFTLVRNGLTIPQDKNVGDYKITRIETISDGFIDESRVRFVASVSEGTLEKYLIRKGDILFSHINSDPHIGKTAIATREYTDLLHGMNLLLLRPNPEVVDPYFLHLVFRFYRQIGVFIKICARAVNQSSINQEKLRALEIPLPPFPEQRSIAHVLSTVQTAIEQQARLIALTRELKSALMHKLFTEGLRGEKQKETEMGLVPESWEQLRLEKTGDVIYGIQAAVANNLQPVGMKILTNKNITLDGQIVLDKINYFELKTKRHFESILKKGDILFNWRSGSKEHIGKTAYFNLDGEYTHSSFILRIRPNDNMNGRFLFWYLYFLRASGYFLQKHDISSVNATFNKSAVDALSVFLPSKNEQEEIASILDTVDSKIALLEQKRNIQEELFRTLLHQLMTGQTRVNEIDLPGLL